LAYVVLVLVFFFLKEEKNIFEYIRIRWHLKRFDGREEEEGKRGLLNCLAYLI